MRKRVPSVSYLSLWISVTFCDEYSSLDSSFIHANKCIDVVKVLFICNCTVLYVHIHMIYYSCMTIDYEQFFFVWLHCTSALEWFDFLRWKTKVGIIVGRLFYFYSESWHMLLNMFFNFLRLCSIYFTEHRTWANAPRKNLNLAHSTLDVHFTVYATTCR